MKNLIQSITCFLLAFLILPTDGNTQSVGQKYMDGIVFEMNTNGKSGMMCKTVDLSTKMGLEDAHRAGADGYGVPDLPTLRKMYTNLKAKGMGGFSNELYWSSKVVSAGYRTAINFADGKESNQFVSSALKVRLVKKFEVSDQAPKDEFDSNAYYRLTCQWQGEGMSLDILNDGKNNQPILAKTGAYSGQYWKINKVGEDTYTLTTKWQGASKKLDCISGPNQNRPVLNESEMSGSAWKITPVGKGYYKITNMWLSDRSLDIVNDGKNNKIQVAKTGAYSGQSWKITKI